MSTKTYSVTVTKEVEATPERIWRVWSKPASYNLVHVTHSCEIDLRVGGLITVQFFEDREAGETFVIQEVDAPRRLVYAWQEQEQHRITLLLTPAGEGMTRVSITQDCQDDPGWINNCLDGWAWILDSLEQYLLTGCGFPNDEWTRRFGTHKVVRTDRE